MRALRRLALLIMAAAVLSAGAPGHLAAGPTHHNVPLADTCPAGTNWDHVLQICD